MNRFSYVYNITPLSIDDFIKKSSIIAFNREGLKALSEDIITFANAEQLTGHANAIKVKLEWKSVIVICIALSLLLAGWMLIL